MRRWRIPKNNIVSQQCGTCLVCLHSDSRVQSINGYVILTSFTDIKPDVPFLLPPFDCDKTNMFILIMNNNYYKYLESQ